MRAAWKMVIFLVLMLMIYAGFGWVMNWQLLYIANLVDMIYAHPLATTREALNANHDIIAIDRNIKDILIAKDPSRLDKRLLMDLDLYKERLAIELDSLFHSVLQNRGRVVTFQAMALLNERNAVTKKFTAAITNKNKDLATQIEFLEGQKITKKIEDAMDTLVGYAASKSNQLQNESKKSLKRSEIILSISGIIILALSIIFAIMTGRMFFLSLRKTRVAIQNIAKGPINLSVRLRKDSISDIDRALDNLLHNLSTELVELRSLFVDTSNKVDLACSSIKKRAVELTALVGLCEKTIDYANKTLKNYRLVDKRLYVFANTFDHLRSELGLLARYATSFAFLVEQGPAHPISHDDLERHSALIKDSIDKSQQLIKEIMERSKHIVNQLSELAKIVNQNITVNLSEHEIDNISHLKTCVKNLYDRLNELKS